MSHDSQHLTKGSQGEGATTRPWFPYVKRLERPRHRLFCMHHAGGSASAFRPWVQPLIRADIELWALQLPGRETRYGEAPFEDMATAAGACAAAIAAHLGVPYTLFGHSVGAKLAFATAQLLAADGAPPSRLVVSASRAPQFGYDDLSIRHDLPRDQLLAALVRLGGTPPQLLEHPDFLDLLLPVLRADLKLNETSHHLEARALDVPLSAFGGADDMDVTREQIEGWLQLTRAAGEVEQLPGGHSYLFDPDNQMPERLARLVLSRT